MIRVILAVIILAVIFWFGIEAFRKMTGKDKWALTKSLGYAIICSLLAIALLITIVVLF
jgi:hypothetical protein